MPARECLVAFPCRSFFSFLVMNKTGLIIFNNILRKCGAKDCSVKTLDIDISFSQQRKQGLEMLSVFLEQSGEIYQPQQGHILTVFQFNATSFFSFFPFLLFSLPLLKTFGSRTKKKKFFHCNSKYFLIVAHKI